MTPTQANELCQSTAPSRKHVVWPQPHDSIRTRVCDTPRQSALSRPGGLPWARKGVPKNAGDSPFGGTIASQFQSGPASILRDGSCSPTEGGRLLVASQRGSLQN